jgi:hypothetical protein
MTKQEANKIKKVLRKENAVFGSTAGYYDGIELRVKVAEFIVRSKYEGVTVKGTPAEQKKRKTLANTGKVLMALSRNGMRPEYRTEQRETSNDLGTFDTRYVIFK